MAGEINFMHNINLNTSPGRTARRTRAALPLAALALCGLLTGGPVAPAAAAPEVSPEVATMPTGASTFPRGEERAALPAGTTAVPKKDAERFSGTPVSPKYTERVEREMAGIFDQPRTVELFSNGARISVVADDLLAEIRDNQPVLSLILPESATDVSPSVEGGRILRWMLTPVASEPQGEVGAQRRQLLERADELEGRIAALNARMDLHRQLPDGSSSEAVEALAALAGKTVPDLMAERQKLMRDLEQIQKLLKVMPAPSGQGKRLQIVLAEFPGKPVRVACTYTLYNCGWLPRYSLNARPDEGKVDIVMSAEIQQYSGMDWDKTRLLLFSRPLGILHPSDLPDWVIDAAPQPLVLGSNAAPMTAIMQARAKSAADQAEISAAGPQPVENGAYMRWELPTASLPQGTSVLCVAREEWDAPLRWLARPHAADSRVWMFADHTFTDRPAWPDGITECRIDGQHAGRGTFHAEGGKVRLFFGVDPRVTVRVTDESRKENEGGIINARRVWRWNWRYTLHNERPNAIEVRLERPQPRPVDERVSVKVNGTPAPATDQAEHVLYWNVKVPARGSADVRQAVELSAPADLPLAPVAP